MTNIYKVKLRKLLFVIASKTHKTCTKTLHRKIQNILEFKENLNMRKGIC